MNKKYLRAPLKGILAAGAFECAYLGVKGELTKDRAFEIFGSSLSSWAAAEVGATIGSIAGPVGTIIGGAIGGAIGLSSFHKTFKFGENQSK